MQDPSTGIKPGQLWRSSACQVEYRQRFNPRTSHLDLLSCGTYIVQPGAVSDELFHRAEESLLFCVDGRITATVGEASFRLAHYDVLYVPMAAPYTLANEHGEEARVILCKAPASVGYAPYHAVWDAVRADEARIRRLAGKDVYLMFDVSEPANCLMAGYTIYRPHTRAWPAHNHTDQEEVYIFTRGLGAMEIYAEEETKTFVYSMEVMDAASIPRLNYHPVFSQEQELHFIWCIAGERYWVGDRHQQFMTGDVDRLTT
jgi:mannose-6-phosphate isomerase-like protein (cupin superfamily)